MKLVIDAQLNLPSQFLERDRSGRGESDRASSTNYLRAATRGRADDRQRSRGTNFITACRDTVHRSGRAAIVRLAYLVRFGVVLEACVQSWAIHEPTLPEPRCSWRLLVGRECRQWPPSPGYSRVNACAAIRTSRSRSLRIASAGASSSIGLRPMNQGRIV